MPVTIFLSGTHSRFQNIPIKVLNLCEKWLCNESNPDANVYHKISHTCGIEEKAVWHKEDKK